MVSPWLGIDAEQVGDLVLDLAGRADRIGSRLQLSLVRNSGSLGRREQAAKGRGSASISAISAVAFVARQEVADDEDVEVVASGS